MKQQIPTSEGLRQVKQIFQAAIELPSDKRDAYLADACADDPSLRAEIESLIAAHEQPGSFLDTPAFDLAATDSAVNQANELLGASLGHYRILEFLGRGGMGEVYKAKDTTLGREVAIKVLPSNFSINRDQLRRFEQEARAASALNHPNIITIHEFGQQDGVHFIISGFIEGETLIYSLSRLSNLKVRPCNSVFRYKGRELDPQAAGRELKVEAVLAGQIKPHGDQIVISLELIDVRDNRQIWGARYQRRLADLLTVQADIAREVSENLRLRLSSEEQRRLAS